MPRCLQDMYGRSPSRRVLYRMFGNLRCIEDLTFQVSSLTFLSILTFSILICCAQFFIYFLVSSYFIYYMRCGVSWRGFRWGWVRASLAWDLVSGLFAIQVHEDGNSPHAVVRLAEGKKLTLTALLFYLRCILFIYSGFISLIIYRD